MWLSSVVISLSQPSIWGFLWTLKASVSMWQVSSQLCFSKCELRVTCMCLPQNNCHDWLNSPLCPPHEWGKEKKKSRRSIASLGEEQEERLRRQRGWVEVSSIAYKLIENSGVVQTCPGSESKAFCLCCKAELVAELTVLKNHSKSKKTQRERKKECLLDAIQH